MIQNNETRRMNWTPCQEDALLDAVARGDSFKAIAKMFPGRSKEACRQRYGILCRERGITPRPDQRGLRWSREEDSLLYRIGSSRNLTWQQIQAKYFPKRTATSLASRFHDLQKRARLDGDDAEAGEDMAADRFWRAKARKGSQRLLDRINAYYARRASEMGVAA